MIRIRPLFFALMDIGSDCVQQHVTLVPRDAEVTLIKLGLPVRHINQLVKSVPATVAQMLSFLAFGQVMQPIDRNAGRVEFSYPRWDDLKMSEHRGVEPPRETPCHDLGAARGTAVHQLDFTFSHGPSL